MGIYSCVLLEQNVFAKFKKKSNVNIYFILLSAKLFDTEDFLRYNMFGAVVAIFNCRLLVGFV